MFKKVTALAVGTVSAAGGIHHFDPDREDEGGRYAKAIVPDEVAAKAEKRNLVSVDGDATEAEHKKWKLDIEQALDADKAAERIMDLPDDETYFLAGGTAPGTAAGRNYPAGQGPDAPQFPADPDAAPGARQGDEDDDNEDKAGDPALNQSVPKLKDHLATITDADELDRLHKVEEEHQNRSSAKAAIDERKGQL